MYLLDASSVYPIIIRLREEVMEHTDLFSVLDLTLYEVGNALWKEYKRGKIKNMKSAVALFREFLNDVTVMGHPPLEETLDLAVKENLTFYDASYLCIAKKEGMRLVSEDKDLLRFPQCISVDELVKELKELDGGKAT
ncbi:MAG: type II toxin-antitoxin system VapC family toxin [Candidatus Korarchaeota archaeon]|nr:type II toxin-antitoxin system VapC family toxin [Candidatus Korarchaeota archaeon]